MALWLVLAQQSLAENSRPVAYIDDISPHSPLDTQTVHFSGHGDDPDGEITAWAWSSDLDGGMAETSHFVLSHLSVGNHNISFRVRDDSGNWSEAVNEHVKVQENDPPTLSSANLSATEVYRGDPLDLLLDPHDDRTADPELVPRLEYRPGQPEYSGWENVTGDVYGVEVSENGEYIAVGSMARRIFLFARGSDEPLWSYPVGKHPEVAISADGRYIAGKSWDQNVHLFHCLSPEPLWTYDTNEKVYSVEISSDARYMAAGTASGKVYLFHRGSSTPLWSYATGGQVDTLKMSSDGSYLVAGSYDDRVYLFGRDSSTPLWNYTTQKEVDAVDITSDGEYIVAGSKDDRVYLFDQEGDEPLWQYKTDGQVDGIAISDDGRYIVAGSDDEYIYFFSRDDPEPLWSHRTDGKVKAVAISGNGQVIAAGSKGHSLYLFHPDSPEPIWTSMVGGDLWKVSLSTNGEDLAAGVYHTFGGLADDSVYFFSQWQGRDITAAEYIDERWQVTHSPHLLAPLGTYDYRVRFIDGHDALGDWSYIDPTSEILNHRPTATIDGISPDTPFDTQTVTLIGHAEDLDGDGVDLGYYWESDIDGYLGDMNRTFVDGLTHGTHTLTFRVRDGDGAWSDNVSTTVEVLLNDLPEISSIQFSRTRVLRGERFELVIDADDDTDAESELGIELEYREQDWNGIEPIDIEYRDSGWHLNLTLAKGEPGSYSLRARAIDTLNGVGDWYTSFTSLSLENNPPVAVIDSVIPQRSNYTGTISFAGHGEDPDGVITGYRWYSSINGILSDQPTFDIRTLEPGNHTISFSVQDSDGDWSGNSTILHVVNGPPVAIIEDLHPTKTTEGTLVSFSGHGEDRDGVIVSHRWRSSLMGVISREPDFASFDLRIGAHTIYYAVEDDSGIWSSETQTSIFVNARPMATISDTTTTFAHSGDLVTLDADTTDMDGYIVEWKWTSNLNGVLDLSSGPVIDDLQPGNHIITLQVMDDFGSWSEPAKWTLRINHRPTATLVVGPGIVVQGAKADFQVESRDPDGEVTLHELRFEPVDPALGQWFEYAPQERWSLATTSFTPGNYTVLLSVLDDEGGWSDPTSSWLYVNAPPVAYTGTFEVTGSGDRAVVTLNAEGQDDEAIVAYQWRSDVNGVLTITSTPYVQLYNLSAATHRISVRVQDEKGLWSEWVEWNEPLIIASNDQPGLLALVEGVPLVGLLALFTLVLLGSAGMWHRRTRLYDLRVKEPLARLRRLARMHEDAALVYPREEYDRVVGELSLGRYRNVGARPVILANQMHETLELYGTAQNMLTSAQHLNQVATLADERFKFTDREENLEDQMNVALEHYDEARHLLEKARALAANTRFSEDEFDRDDNN